jgi:ligand-binding sensor domain-containing protein
MACDPTVKAFMYTKTKSCIISTKTMTCLAMKIYSMVATKNAGIWVATDLGVQELHFEKGKKKF